MRTSPDIPTQQPAADTPQRPDDALAARRLVLGRLSCAAVHAAVVLGIPAALRDDPAAAPELAARLGADLAALGRLLDALVALGVVDRGSGDRYGLTGVGRSLLADAPGTAAPTALLAGGEIGRAWDGLAHAVRTGTSAFVANTGTDVFGYLATDPATQATFYRSQAADLELNLDRLDRVDFARYPTIVDVGGGDGALLAHLLERHPAGRGVLLDAPNAAAAAGERFSAAGLGARTIVVAGDFFAAVPPGGDLYLLRDVLHDWSDDRCRDLLGVCRRDMPSTATLLVIDRVARRGVGDDLLIHLMDLYMLSVLGGGRERTAAELDELLTSAGFRIRDRYELGNATAVEATAAGRDG
nr:O-methyltransferase [uncultured bacterium]